MNLLLIVPRYKLTKKPYYDYPFPLGIAYISAVLKKEGYEVTCLNMNHYYGNSERIINRELDSKKYDFVGTGNNALGYVMTKLIISTVRKHISKPKIILGGPIITSEPEIIFNDLKPDFGIIGEGEKTILELLDFLNKKKDLKLVNGIIYFNQEGKIIKTQKRKVISDLDSLPFPDTEALGLENQLNNIHTNVSYYTNVFNNPRVYSILSSRSCPFQCTFCYHDSTYRKRSIKNVIKEINQAITKYKINVFLIYDECFALDKKRVDEFCREIKKIQTNVPWKIVWACQMRVETVNRRMLETMKGAGCIAISYGFESYSQEVLRSMHKNITPEQIDHAFRETLNAKINIQANFIFGDIAETKETARKTLNYWKNNCKGQVNLTFIQPYPGSEIYEHCIKKGIIKDRLDFIKNNITGRLFLNMTSHMSDEEVANLKKEILDSIKTRFIFIKPVSLKKENNLTYSVFVKCPFCKEQIWYKNCFIENKYTYGFSLVCRNCFMHFLVISPLQKIAYSYYPKLRRLIEFYLNSKNKILKKMV